MKKSWQDTSFKLGILGGGQLGRMFIQEAINYNINIHILDPDGEAPCSGLTPYFTTGSLNDFDTVLKFGSELDVLTVEIENVNTDALKHLQANGVKVFPQPEILELIRDKGLQKEFYKSRNLPTAPFTLSEGKDNLKEHIAFLPFVQKLRTGGYDGKGVKLVKNFTDFEQAFDAPCVLEKLIPFTKELSVIVARNESGETRAYPVVECEFNPRANLVEYLFSPAEISADIEKRAEDLAIKVIDELGMIGILAVEFFLLEDGELLINEIAPRTHNSGHHTIECSVTSQFEQHLRSILDLPLGSTEMTQSGVMLNLLGEEGYEGEAVYTHIEEIMALRGVHVHLYGKSVTKPYRKMGHVTIAMEKLEEAKELAPKVKNLLKVISKK